MSFTEHNGAYSVGSNGSVLTYSRDDSYAYGIRLVKEIYLGATLGYRVVAQSVKIVDGEVKETGDLSVWTSKDLIQEYQYLWSATPSLKDGDVLRDITNKHVFVVKGNMSSGKPKLFRVSSGVDYTYDSYENYTSSYGRLAKAKLV